MPETVETQLKNTLIDIHRFARMQLRDVTHVGYEEFETALTKIQAMCANILEDVTD